MNQATAINTIKDIIQKSKSIDEMAYDLYWAFAVESWTHTSDEYLTFDDLTDAEFRLVISWYLYNKFYYIAKSPTNWSATLTDDMSEMFPGLSMADVSALIR